jgi:hypothetical protein
MWEGMKGLLAPEFKETCWGHAVVRNVFRINGAGPWPVAM